VTLNSSIEVDDRDVDELAAIVKARLTITRNDSVSERLWRLITSDGNTRAEWLIAMPTAVWEIVRDTVLRCS
jgi:hypothetical protein